MRTVATHWQVARHSKLAGLLCLLTALAHPPVGMGTPPIEPLPLPDYSFDLGSPSVPGDVAGADILTLEVDSASTLIPAEDLGLDPTVDDVDALSAANPLVAPEDTFVLLFSVDRDTVGTVPPAPELIDLEVPYNVWDQAQRGHAAGDQYLSTTLYARTGQMRARTRDPNNNNTLDRNNYDEGGTSFGAQPATPARGQIRRAEQDNVDATARLTRDTPRGPIVDVYFSLTAGSPSAASGANILFNPDPLMSAETTLYAEYSQLGLAMGDDIDALVVFDTNDDGSFNGSDEVLFSLAPGSPSLATIPGASLNGAAADVFVVIHEQAPALFTAASELGLGNPLDNVDALDYAFCGDPIYCAAQHGIRELFGDLNCDGSLNGLDIYPFVLVLTGTPPDYPEYHDVHGDCDHMLADCNRDGSINGLDIDPFVDVLTGL